MVLMYLLDDTLQSHFFCDCLSHSIFWELWKEVDAEEAAYVVMKYLHVVGV